MGMTVIHDNRTTAEHWQQHPDLEVHRAELARLRAIPEELRDNYREKERPIVLRLQDHASQSRALDLRELRRLQQTFAAQIEAAEDRLREAEALTYDLEFRARQEWIAAHGDACRHEHGDIVRRLVDTLEAARELNADLMRLQAQTSGAVDLSPGPIPTLDAAVAVWFRQAREAGLVK